MKFYDDKTEDDKIIEYLESFRNCYVVKYLYNDDIDIFYSENRYEKKKIEMLDQAIKRDKELFGKYKNYSLQCLFTFNLSLVAFAFSTKGNLQYISCLLFIISIFYGFNLINDLKKYFELKKYHNFLEIKDDLKKEENKDILNVIEFDKYYQNPKGIEIDTLDEYSCHDIHVIKKEIKRRNKKKK